MKAALLKFTPSLLFAALVAAGGATIAASFSHTQSAGTVSQAPDGPVDCRKTPDHPRRKNKK